jgi:hypothetical protein
MHGEVLMAVLYVFLYLAVGFLCAVGLAKKIGPPPEVWFNGLVIIGWPFFLAYVAIYQLCELVNRVAGHNENP